MKKFDGIILLSDLDSTLTYFTEMPSKNIEAIRYFIDNGGLFTLATGRTPEYIIKNFDTSLINAPLVSINGTLIYDIKADKILKSYEFSHKYIAAAKYVLKKYPVPRLSIHSITEYFYENPKLSDLDNFDKTIRKMVFAFETEDITLKARDDLIKEYGNECDIERSWATGLEIRSKGSGKGVCLKFVKEYTNSKTAIGIGDYENDRSLLKAADIAFAPENALDEIKQLANHITVHCKDGAIHDIIFNYLDK